MGIVFSRHLSKQKKNFYNFFFQVENVEKKKAKEDSST